jgi:hypothetical protein
MTFRAGDKVSFVIALRRGRSAIFSRKDGVIVGFYGQVATIKVRGGKRLAVHTSRVAHYGLDAMARYWLE